MSRSKVLIVAHLSGTYIETDRRYLSDGHSLVDHMSHLVNLRLFLHLLIDALLDLLPFFLALLVLLLLHLKLVALSDEALFARLFLVS